MGPNIYKPGQGYWTRTMSALGFGAVALMGGLWFSEQFRSVQIEGVPDIYIRATAFFTVVAVAGILIYYFIGKKRKTVDFMIATEGEMKKVNWSTKREVFGMTWVVIGMTVLIAIFIAAFDLIYAGIMAWAKVLDAGV